MGDSSSPSLPPPAESEAGQATTGERAADAAGRSGGVVPSSPADTSPASRQPAEPQLPPQPQPRQLSQPPPPEPLQQQSQPTQLAQPVPTTPPSPSSQTSQSSQAQTLQPTSTTPAAPPPTPPPPVRKRSFFSRFAFRPHARTIADFHIRPTEPHRKYVAGDHVHGHVVLAVVKPLRITHLTVSLRGLVRVFKDPTAAAAAVPTDTAADATPGRHGASSLAASFSSSPSGSTSSSSYLGNGHAILFRDEVVLSGGGRLEPGKYEFGFDLIFPAQDLPSSIDFERGSISYLVTATLTRPTSVTPVQSCERKVYLVDPVDIGAVSKPRPRTISLEPISKKSRKRKIVVTQRPAATTTQSQAQVPTQNIPGPYQGSTVPRSSTSAASGGDGALSDRGSMRGSSHEMQIDSSVAAVALDLQHPQSPAPTDIRSEFSADSVASGGTSLSGRGGSGSGSGSVGAGGGGGFGSESAQSGRVRLASPAGSQAGSVAVGTRQGTGGPGSNASGGTDERTITATIELLKGGCLPGEIVSVKIAIQHVKRIKSLHGVVVTLYRQGRIDSAPPSSLFGAPSGSASGSSTATATANNGNNGTGWDDHGGTNLEEIPEGQPGGADDSGGPNSQVNGQPNSQSNGLQQQHTNGHRREDENPSSKPQKQKSRRHRHDRDEHSTSHDGQHGERHHENYYPKSKTGLGGLSLTSAGSCSVFRKDLSQSFSPLIIDPRTLQSSVTASVRVPEDAFATIKGVPGDMISFKYQLEVIVDLGGKLASLLQSSGQSGSGGGGGGGGGMGSSGGVMGVGLDATGKPLGGMSTPLWGGTSNSTHMVDTDQLRRQKGVIYVSFEVIVGTTDSSRLRARGASGISTIRPSLPPDLPIDMLSYQQYQQYQQYLLQQQQQQQQQQDTGYPPPLPPPLPGQPGWSYPEDRKDSHIQWAGTNGQPAATGAGPASDPNYRQPPHQQHQQYYDYFNANGGGSVGPSTPSGPASNPYTHQQQPPYTPPIEAPQYVPTVAMLAGDSNLSEKERIRRAEERLLPSQPGQPGASGSGSTNLPVAGSSSGPSDTPGPSGPSAPSVPSPSEPSAPVENSAPGPEFASQAPLHAPSAPTMEELSLPHTAPGSSIPYASGSAAGAVASASSASAAAYAHAPGGQPPTEDKQELERRRLLAEASAPPEFPEDYEDPSMSRGGPSAPPAPSVPSAPSAPSAPVLEDEFQDAPYYSSPPEDELHQSAPQQQQHTVVVPILEAAGHSRQNAGTSNSNYSGQAPDETEEDRYGQHYAYGPGAGGAGGANVGNAAAPAEPLPRYER